MPETPIQAIHILFMFIVIIGVRLGIEVISRAGEIFMPWIILLFVVLVLFLTPEIEMSKIQPILGQGFSPLLQALFPLIGLILEISVFLMIIPFVNNPKKTLKPFIHGSISGGIALFLFVLLSILVLGAELTARQVYPSYVLAKKISVADILERLETFMAAMWFLTIYFKLTICFYASTLGFGQILNLKEYRSLTWPLGMILIVLSIEMIPNRLYFNQIALNVWPYYSITVCLVIPIILLLLGILHKKRQQSSS